MLYRIFLAAAVFYFSGQALVASFGDDVVRTTKPAQLKSISRFAWPTLGQNRTIALGEALKKADNFKTKVTVWCATADCASLASDFDDAFQIAGINSDLDHRELDSSNDAGIFVGPPGPQANTLATAITVHAGLTVVIVEAPSENGLVLIIGKKPR